MARTAWFLAYLLGAYVIAWVSFSLLGLEQLAGRLSAWLATWLLDLATPTTVTSTADGEGVMFLLDTGHKIFYDTRISGRTVPLLFAVVFAITQRLSWRVPVLLGAGLAAILLLDSLALAGWVWTQFGSALPTTWGYPLLRIFSIWNEGGWSFVPIFIAALFALNLSRRA